MNHAYLPQQDNRTIHTPAICDSRTEKRKTRANAGFQRSTAASEAVHFFGQTAQSPSAKTAFSVAAQQ
jgi:hypothetical protein